MAFFNISVPAAVAAAAAGVPKFGIGGEFIAGSARLIEPIVTAGGDGVCVEGETRGGGVTN